MSSSKPSAVRCAHGDRVVEPARSGSGQIQVYAAQGYDVGLWEGTKQAWVTWRARVRAWSTWAGYTDRCGTFRPSALLWCSAPTWRNLQTSGMLLGRG